MILTLNAANTIYCFMKISGYIYKPSGLPYCKTAITISRVFICMSILASTLFGHTLYTITKYESLEAIEKYMKRYLLVLTVVPLTLGFSSGLTNYISYSQTQHTCVHLIYPGEIDTLLIFLVIIPTAICCILSAYWFIKAGGELNAKGLRGSKADSIALLIYPGIVIFCWIPILTYNVLKGFGYIQPSETVDVVMSNIYQLQGLLDAVTYGIAPRVKECCARRYSRINEKDVGSNHSLVILSSPNLTDSESQRDHYFQI